MTARNLRVEGTTPHDGNPRDEGSDPAKSPDGLTVPRGALPVGLSTGGRAATAGIVLVGAAIPYLGSRYLEGLLVLFFIYATVNVSWNLVLGHGGVFTFGQMGFFAVGGYTSAILSTQLGLPPLLATTVGILAAGLAGFLVALPSLRLRGPYMVLFTLAFQMAIAVTIATDTSGILGGAVGIRGVPAYTIGGLEDVAYYIALVMLVVSTIAIGRLLKSPIGVGVRALRDSTPTAVARGVNLVVHRTIIFVVSAAVTGLAGAFYAHHFGVITPTVLDLGLLVNLLAMIIIGGTRSNAGVIGGTALLVYLNNLLAAQQQYSALIWGLVIILVVLLFPGGLAEAGKRAWTWLDKAIDSWLEVADKA